MYLRFYYGRMQLKIQFFLLKTKMHILHYEITYEQIKQIVVSMFDHNFSRGSLH